MELVAEIIKELDERDRKLKSAVANKDCDESSFGMSFSQRKRKRIEECFGWLKTIALLRKVRHRGVFKVGWVFTFAAAAYNLVRMRNLAMQST